MVGVLPRPGKKQYHTESQEDTGQTFSFNITSSKEVLLIYPTLHTRPFITEPQHKDTEYRVFGSDASHVLNLGK